MIHIYNHEILHSIGESVHFDIKSDFYLGESILVRDYLLTLFMSRIITDIHYLPVSTYLHASVFLRYFSESEKGKGFCDWVIYLFKQNIFRFSLYKY